MSVIININHAKALTGNGKLGKPSKMPGHAYGLSAHDCKTGSKLAKIPGSVCHNCYALKGNYIFSHIRRSHAARLASIASPLWSAAMAYRIKHTGERYFRWHDSGDLQSVEHLAKICRVAELTPRVRHWLPTRELKFVQEYAAQGGVVPDNLVIRVSATMIDGPATKAWPITSVVYSAEPPKGAHRCVAPDHGNTCGPCRACWSHGVKQVAYHQH